MCCYKFVKDVSKAFRAQQLFQKYAIISESAWFFNSNRIFMSNWTNFWFFGWKYKALCSTLIQKKNEQKKIFFRKKFFWKIFFWNFKFFWDLWNSNEFELPPIQKFEFFVEFQIFSSKKEANHHDHSAPRVSQSSWVSPRNAFL